MAKAKRARKAETPKQPSPCLRLRAPYLYPDPRWTAPMVYSGEGKVQPNRILNAMSSRASPNRTARWLAMRPAPKTHYLRARLRAQAVAAVDQLRGTAPAHTDRQEAAVMPPAEKPYRAVATMSGPKA
jgi:hypothetical protein